MPDRGSTRHSARVDEEMDAEVKSLTRGAPVEARVEEWRQKEPAGEGEPNPDAVTSIDDVESRSLLAVSLRPSAFPGDRAQLLEVAREEHAEERVLAWLTSLPDDRQFETLQSVWEAIGGGYETREAPYLGVDPQIAAPVDQPIESPDASRDTPAPVPSPPVPSPVEVEPASPSLVGRVVGIAFAAGSLAVGVAVEAVRIVRRRL